MSKRNAILEAATRLFARNGFNQTSMSALSKETGAAGGTIFHHFKNKEDIFLNILSDTQDTVLSAFDAHKAASVHKNGMEMVEGAVEFYLNFTLEKQDLFLMLHRHFPYQMAESNDQCRKTLESIYDCLVEIFQQGVELGMKDGSIRVASAHNTAMLLFAMVDGVARLNTYRLYHTGALYTDLVASCRRMLGVKAET